MNIDNIDPKCVGEGVKKLLKDRMIVLAPFVVDNKDSGATCHRLNIDA